MWVTLKVALSNYWGVSGGLDHVVNMRWAGRITYSIGRRFDGFVFVVAVLIGDHALSLIHI